MALKRSVESADGFGVARMRNFFKTQTPFNSFVVPQRDREKLWRRKLYGQSLLRFKLRLLDVLLVE